MYALTVFNAVVFTIAMTGKQIKYLPMDEGIIKKECYRRQIHTYI